MMALLEAPAAASGTGTFDATGPLADMNAAVGTQSPHKLLVRGLHQVFGHRTDDAMAMVAQGADNAAIRARTGAIVAVRGVDLSIKAGEIFVIMGLSGSGKSTLVRCINQLIVPTAGQVLLDGEDMLSFSGRRRLEVRRHKVAMVFQNFGLLSHRTVLQNVEYGLAVRGERPPARRDKAMQSLRMVGLEQWATQYPDELSGGMRQRVGLARALAAEPDVLLMDEPFSALDPLIRRNLQDELLRLQERLHKTIVFVTHDFHEAVKLGDSIAVMRDGRIVQAGTPRQVILSPADDYVADFTRDIDISQALSVGDVAGFAAERGRVDPEFGAPRVRIDHAAPLWQLYPIVSAGAIAVVRDGGGGETPITSRDVLDCLMDHQRKRQEGRKADGDG